MNQTTFVKISLLFIFFLISSAKTFSQNEAADFPPDKVTNQMDRDQMLLQLNITPPALPPKADDPNAPSDAFPVDRQNPDGNWTDKEGRIITRSAWGLWNNYHDKTAGFFPGENAERLGSYSKIDLLKMDNGLATPNIAEWWVQRRPQILKKVQEELYGIVPPDSVLPSVKWSIQTTRGGVGNASFIQKNLTGVVDVSSYPEVKNTPIISAILRIPSEATSEVPVLMKIGGGFGNSMESLWEEAYPNGWGICVFNPTTLQPDNGAGLTSYLIGLVNKGNWRKPSDWGTLGAWSWGVSRLLDYFETDQEVNKKAIGITGHSRYGKAALLAMAYDTRIAIGFPSDAGSLGTSMARRHWGQDLENSASANEYHWMAGNFFNYMGELNSGEYLPRKVENLTVDAQALLALCAPRPVLQNGGTQSTWTDPYGQYLTMVAASPVYEFLEGKGIVMTDSKPKINLGYIEGDLAFRYHDGGHTDAPEWPTFFKFAAKYIDAPYLVSSADAVTLKHQGKSQAVIDISSNVEWEASTNARWFKINEKTTATGKRLTIIAKENPDQVGRSEDITFIAEGRLKRVSVNQAASQPKLEISSNTLEITGNGQQPIAFAISSNTAWNVNVSEDWVKIGTIDGVNKQTINIVAEDNPEVSKRNATITISGPGLESQIINLSQKEGAPTLNIFASSLDLRARANSEANTWISSNTTCKVESTAPWLKASLTKKDQFDRLDVLAEKNPTTEKRTATVKLMVEGLPAKEVVVTQAASEKREVGTVASQPYLWNELEVEETETGEKRQIIRGSTNHLGSLEVYASSIKPKQTAHSIHNHEELEELIIVKTGQIEVDIKGKKEILKPGSIALIFPGDLHGFENKSDSPAEYYVMRYRSRKMINANRGEDEGGSFVVHWDSVAYKEHDKGGRRDFFNRPTVMTDNFEMHVTNLNENTESHKPHTHLVEEVILVVEGEVEMHVDGKTTNVTAGDLIFMDSRVPHAPKNIGTGQAIYFAFQWK